MPNREDPVAQFKLFVEEVQPNADDMLKAGQWFVAKRRSDTISGLDVNGNSFAPYSPAYSFRKGSSAPSLYGKGPGPHMLDALEARYDSDLSSLDIGIFGNEALATRAQVQNEGALIPTVHGSGKLRYGKSRTTGKKGSKAFFRIPARYWLGASDSDLVEMQNIIGESIKERVGG